MDRETERRLRETTGDGTLPLYAWPGGYPVIYYASDGETFCGRCANNENGAECRTRDDADDDATDGWRIDGYATGDLHDDDDDVACIHCGRVIVEGLADNPRWIVRNVARFTGTVTYLIGSNGDLTFDPDEATRYATRDAARGAMGRYGTEIVEYRETGE